MCVEFEFDTNRKIRWHFFTGEREKQTLPLKQLFHSMIEGKTIFYRPTYLRASFKTNIDFHLTHNCSPERRHLAGCFASSVVYIYWNCYSPYPIVSLMNARIPSTFFQWMAFSAEEENFATDWVAKEILGIIELADNIKLRTNQFSLSVP